MFYPQLNRFKLQNISYTQPYLDTSNSSIRELLLAFFSYIANFQLKRYSEDIKSGQKRALAQGKRIGRPKISSSTKELIAEFKSKYISNLNIAMQRNRKKHYCKPRLARQLYIII
jgi:DNA invertase Pin-like site-specific DNA recombinase